ncbi:MAG: Smr/MutS family protein [bacterium]
MAENKKKDEFSKLLEEYSDIDFEIHKREKNSTIEEQKRFFRPSPVRPSHTIDLHGMKKEEALLKVEITVKEMKARGYLKLRIITGKGKHSKNEPVIPKAVNSLLLELKRNKAIDTVSWENKTVENSGFVDVS